MSKKTLILHDTFLYKGGGERLILMMAKALKADIASGFFSSGSFDLRKEGFEGKMIPISGEIFKKGFRHIKLKYAFLFKTKFIKSYDTLIFSGDSISAVRNASKNQKKIYYCHTPPRYLYDLHNLYLEKVPKYLKGVFTFTCKIFRKMYESDIKKMDLILTNSINTQKRIKEFLNIDSEVLYPPVDLAKFKYLGQKDYYMSFARLSDAKRVDRIIEAFKQMPDKKLICTYGVNDPQKEKIFELAKGMENITFIKSPLDSEFVEIMGNAIATIYIPIDEDFGMSSIESMSCGKPVIGVNDGGLKETIIGEKTGILIDKEARVEDIINAVNLLTPEKSLEMRYECEYRAKEFSLENFEKLINNFVNN
ncbi:glycosyltransferase [Candidatus Gracilibacteria bacterium]|nr:glycosyltransferase [Candidatus Gracilibacteria bacterium]